ncbi:MAG: hypothetical protein ACLP52_01280 [Streptosporangiaceae bacterium]
MNTPRHHRARLARFRPATAARQALALCETGQGAADPAAAVQTRYLRPPSRAAARAALRAAGLPPPLAAQLRSRLQLEQEEPAP